MVRIFANSFRLIAFLIVFSNNCFSQDIQKCVDDNLKMGNDIDSLVGDLFNKIPPKDFYLIGETHCFLANSDLLLVLFKKLHERGVYNVVNELPQSTCFLFNEYLQNGADTLLTLIKPHASYKVLKEIREFNLTQPETKRIRFYGIDYLGEDDARNLLMSLKIIRERAKGDDNTLSRLIDQTLVADTFTRESLIHFNALLSDELKGAHKDFYKKYFGDYYNDLLLMGQNYVGFKGRTDKSIYEGFNVMFKAFFENKKSESPKFFAFYGANHLSGFGKMLENDSNSPVKDNVCFIGLQYFNCLGGWSYQKEQLMTTGLQNVIKEKYFESIKDKFALSKSQIGVFLNKDCVKSKSGKSTLDAMIIFNSYGDRRMNSWKFD